MKTYLFGYGSLILEESRARTGVSGKSFPVKVFGLKRSWNTLIESDKTVALGLEENENSYCNGVLFEIPESELERFDEREGEDYDRVRLSLDSIKGYDRDLSDFEVWVYIVKNKGEPSEEYPIEQSYVDVILTGCIEQGLDFAKEFMDTTYGWNFILDDRDNPRYLRALENVEKKDTINDLIRSVVE